jgi:hypothetical protein
VTAGGVESGWVLVVVAGDAQPALWLRWYVLRRRFTGGEDEQCRSGCWFFFVIRTVGFFEQ